MILLELYEVIFVHLVELNEEEDVAAAAVGQLQLSPERIRRPKNCKCTMNKQMFHKGDNCASLLRSASV